MKPWMKWTLALVVVALLGAGIARALESRKAKQTAAAALAAQPVQSTIELVASDVVQAKMRNLAQGLAISGALKAVNSAIIKARVPGELQGLTVREGDLVKAGQVVARVDATEYNSRVRQAQEQADSARAQIAIAQRQFDNNRALVDQGFISKTALDTSSSNLVAAQANHKAAMASVEVARKSVEDTVLRSPISGIVSQRLAQPGERIGVDARVLEIVDLSRIELEAALSAADSVDVSVGQEAQLQIEGASQTLAARVVRINPSAQAGSRSVLVYLSIANPAGLRQGLFAQGTLGTAQRSMLAVPLSAVRTDKPAPYVQTIENGQVAQRTVELGPRGDADGEVMVGVKGIADNASVIRGSVGALRAGTAVKFTATAPAAATSAAPSAVPSAALATPASK
jgi:membrane fusion protein, multidrug efflux system